MEKFLKKNFNDSPFNVLICKTIFSIIFPKYQEKLIRESWKIIVRILNSFLIETTFDVFSGSIQIWTTKFTKDPFAIINARDFLKLIARSVPVNQAAKIFDDGIVSDIIKISCFVRNKKIFLKRRKRLIGINGSTIKTIEIITQTYILVQGNTVSCMGTYSGIKQVQKIVEDCMKNIHPIFHIKILMMKQEFAKDLNLKKESWNRYIPFSKSAYVNSLKKLSKEKKKKNPENFFHGKCSIIYEKFSKKLISEKKNKINNKFLSPNSFIL